jgi:hypothetical protein
VVEEENAPAGATQNQRGAQPRRTTTDDDDVERGAELLRF